MTAARNYVQEERAVSDRPGTFRYIVRAYSILTTDTVMFDAYEPIVGPRWSQHGTSTMSAAYGPLGAVRTRSPEAATLALPYGEERTARVLTHYRATEAECETAIRRAFPELAAVAAFQHGHATVDLDEYHAVVPA